ncbi:phosphoenolpyruvate synthase [Patescibacteria group bacterium]|nr:phosphoenolpyruvate synthase [Patescibacteria group bacterium]
MKSRKDKYILFFSEIGKKDISLVGGKNAALGEMYGKISKLGINVPNGFSVTAKAYFDFIKESKLNGKIADILSGLDTRNVEDLQNRSEQVRNLITQAEFSEILKKQIIEAYEKLSAHYKTKNLSVAVRSSATAEDLPMASFAGQLESYLNISGERELLSHIRKSFASLFTDRAISYREDKHFPLWRVGVSVGVQKMVRSDRASAGVMFTLETESGFRDLVMIDAGWGLGENVVKGRISPDEYFVFKKTLNKKFKPIIKKFIGEKEWTLRYSEKNAKTTKNILTKKEDRIKTVLSDEEILILARYGMAIENHFKRPMDIEWAKDGADKKIYIVQARPETVHTQKLQHIATEFSLKEKSESLVSGVSIGRKISTGIIRVIKSEKELSSFHPGEILVAKSTDPAWEPIMKKAAAIITDSGGRTCHAAIVSRELGVPCVVGTGNATEILKTGQKATVDCASGAQGKVYSGWLKFDVKKINLKKIKLPSKVDIMMNIGSPEIAFVDSFLPNRGVGLAREEFIISNYIKVHPLALLDYLNLPAGLKNKIEKISPSHENKAQFFVDKLAEGVGQIAAAFFPKEVIVRFSDFKTNEYRSLLGGNLYEPAEANPMLGWRGASRYYDEKFKKAFVLEINAIKKVINEFGLNNVNVMIPFCRSVEEAKKVIQILAENGLKRNKNFKIYLMCELPVNIILAEEFLKLVDGYSIGSNDLTQLILGVDRDSALVSEIYDELNPAVLRSISQVIKICRKKKKKIGICGQAPSDFPEFARFLVKNKINSMSLTPDSVTDVISNIRKI